MNVSWGLSIIFKQRFIQRMDTDIMKAVPLFTPDQGQAFGPKQDVSICAVLKRHM
jgi:hypothetical protein